MTDQVYGEESADRGYLAGFALWLAKRATEFALVLQIWFIANIHRAEVWIGGPLELAKAGYKAWDWTGRFLEYLDKAIELLKLVDERTYYALLKLVFQALHIRPSHSKADWVLIVLGSIYVAWTTGTKIYGGLINWWDKRAVVRKLQTELENDASILFGIIGGLLLGGPVGAVVGGILGAVGKSSSKAEIAEAAKAEAEARFALPAVVLGALAAAFFDAVLQWGPLILHRIEYA